MAQSNFEEKIAGEEIQQIDITNVMTGDRNKSRFLYYQLKMSMGLLKCGNVVIPFDNQIGKDTSLYKLYNTNLHEKIAEQKDKDNQVLVV